MRVYEFAKELGKDAGDLLEELNGNFGFDIKSHLSGISKEQMEQVRITYGDNKPSNEEAKTHHEEAMKDSFNIDESIKTNVDTAGKAREQYAKTVKKIVEDPEQWSNLNVKKQESPKEPKQQEIIVEKPSWWSRIFSWWSSS